MVAPAGDEVERVRLAGLVRDLDDLGDGARLERDGALRVVCAIQGRVYGEVLEDVGGEMAAVSACRGVRPARYVVNLHMYLLHRNLRCFVSYTLLIEAGKH